MSSPAREPRRPTASAVRRAAIVLVAALAVASGPAFSPGRAASAGPVAVPAPVEPVVAPRPRPRPRPLRIMPLGDSITVGVGSTTRSGYRTDLADRLAAAGVPADFVGSQRSGRGCDPDNEGHVGWTIERIAAHVDAWLATYRPDVVLLHIGTNDTGRAGSAAAAPAKLSALIDRITADRPDADIFVAEIIATADTGRNVRTDAYNAKLPAVVAGKGPRVHLVDQSAVGGPDLFNTLHPNDFGYAVMSGNWYRALASVLGAGPPPWPVLETPYAATPAYRCVVPPVRRTR